MLLPLLGLKVLCAIPPQAITGLLAGTLKITGGVIRYASGTSKAGQIFMHLLPGGNLLFNMIPGLDFLPGLAANFQLHKISGKLDTLQKITELNTYQLLRLSGQVNNLTQMTQNVLHLATGTAVLSGLGLAVSSIGFLAVNKKLNAINERLQEIQKDVRAIRQFLEMSEKAELMAALSDLMKITESTPEKHRELLLANANHSLHKISKKYQELLANSTSINEAIAYEEYFALTALAKARCSAELGMLNIARQEMDEMASFWKHHARRIAKDMLIGQYPQRFLASDFAGSVPISAFVSWLDFANDKEKGYDWIDELRLKMNERWYENSNLDSAASKFGKAIIGIPLWETSDDGLNKGIGVGIKQEKEVVIPTLQKLIARNNVFEGYRGQYEVFEARQIRPSEFQQQLMQLPEKLAIEGCFVLQPTKEENREEVKV
ncbi:hypothetical protein U14_00280 [Candidatus Moduliflexus flocculans]|uniref:Uncharacterized protein n=1 Tax=Candidatus Moduliflexus flocculans TaxID=1499966 RepID=A0A0S6VVJ2_9BACT|nr:hypothetical protein U14_00280 [Candidatus Moduliflexus flocculans]